MNPEALSHGGPVETVVRRPGPAVTFVLFYDGVERELDRLGPGLRPEDLLRLLELDLIEGQRLGLRRSPVSLMSAHPPG